MGVGSPLPSRGTWGLNSGVRFGSKCLFPLTHLSGLNFISFCFLQHSFICNTYCPLCLVAMLFGAFTSRTLSSLEHKSSTIH